MRMKNFCFVVLGLTLLAVPASTLTPDATEDSFLILGLALLAVPASARTGRWPLRRSSVALIE